MFEYINCRLCDADDYHVLYRSTVNDLTIEDADLFRQSDANSESCQIVKCNRCGLVYTNPREPVELISRLYRAVEDEDYVNQIDWKKAAYRWNLSRLEKHIDGGNILDIGCGHGFFLSLLSDKWKRFGLEPAEAVALYAREELGLDVFSGFLAENTFEPESFDALTMFHVLEHTYSPRRDLDTCYDLLKPGGYIYIEVPDFGSALSRWRKRKWWYIMRFHTYYFTRHTLLMMLANAGFEPVDVHYPLKYWHLGYMSRKASAVFAAASPIARLIELAHLGRITVPIRPNDIIGVIARKA